MVANTLLELGAFRICAKPFKWASGIDSPFYCDNRLLLSYPHKWKQVIGKLEELVVQNFPQCTVLAGVATAGIPHASVLAQQMALPMVYIRSAAKAYGQKNRIEGKISPHDKVVVIEDLISSGGSSLNACKAIDAQVLGVVSIFDYELKIAQKNFAAAGILKRSLTSLSEILALQNLSIAEQEMVRDFQEQNC